MSPARNGPPPSGGGRKRRPPTSSGRRAGASPASGRPGGKQGKQGKQGRQARQPESKPTGRAVKVPKGLGGEQVEGRHAVREVLLAQRRRVRELWVSAGDDDDGVLRDILELAAASRVTVTRVSVNRLDAAARTDAPQGVLARCAPIPEVDLDELTVRRRGHPVPFLVALDGVTDPGNLGAVLRSADGAGATGIVLPKHRAVHVTPTVAKAAAGAVEHLPMTLVGGLPTALRVLKERGFWVVGLDGVAEQSLFDLADLGDEPVVLVLGSEGSGLSRLVRERCDVVVSIPMRGALPSLNVSVAAALALFEVARRRAN